MAIWNKRCETMGRADLEQLQLERLQATVNRAYRNVRFYRRQFHELGVAPEEIQSLEDVRKLPFTTQEDLRVSDPYQMFAVPLREIVRIHCSSAMGERVRVVGYTRNDVRTWTELVARTLAAGGVSRQDVVQITFDYGLLTGGFGMHYGAERIGASVIPAAAGNTERQIQIMQSFRTTALVGTPSYALHIAGVMEEQGIDPESLYLRVGLFGGEPWSEGTRQELERRLGLTATDNYGVSEVMGPGVAGECECKNGLHLSEDHFLAEVIDPTTLKPVPPGNDGELVLTTLTKEGIPLIRFRTRDITRLLPGECACGRTTLRMSKVLARTDEMLIIRGVNFYPSQVEGMLAAIEGVEPHYQIVVERERALDELTIHVEVSPEIFTGRMSALVELESRIRARMHAVMGLTPKLKLVEPRTLEAEVRASGRVIDRREL